MSNVDPHETFVDSTIWIEFFRGRDGEIQKIISPLIAEDKIYYNGIILSELLIGAKSTKEYDFLKENFEGFKYLNTSKSIFIKAVEIGRSLRSAGTTIPLTDLFVIAHALDNNLLLITKDKHFSMAKEIISELALRFIA